MNTEPTPEQVELVHAAINGDEICKSRPVPYMTLSQRDELRALMNAGREIDAWREVKRAWNIAWQKSTENALIKARELDTHNIKMRHLRAQLIADTDTKVEDKAVTITAPPEQNRCKDAPQARHKLRDQEKAIIDKLSELGQDPKALPRFVHGKQGVKATCKLALANSPLFEGSTTFNKAWERLRHFNEIAEVSSP